MEWINNPWVVGIGGGILSGLLVTLVSRALLSRRDKKEYVQKLLSANREVIYALRPGLSEGHVPDTRVVESLIAATARKYAVDVEDLYNSREVSEELIKEIMDSSFISARTKADYCNQLESLRPAATLGEQESLASRSHLERYRARMVSMMSVMLGIVTTLMTAMLVLSDFMDLKIVGGDVDSITFLLPAVAALLATTMMATITMLRRRRVRERDGGAAHNDEQASGNRTPEP